MSDYGDDDFSDFGGEDWMYIEEEYMIADELAEHAVNSPPPATYPGDDEVPEFDLFDYYNDLEYQSDGYDDAAYYIHGSEKPKAGLKRKRSGNDKGGKKHHKSDSGGYTAQSDYTPVVWMSHPERSKDQKMFDEAREKPYALLKDWRERLADIPAWTAGANADSDLQERLSDVPRLASTDEEDDHEEEAEIDPAVLMAALQNRLSAAGGPLNGMDPQQLLQFAMRMMADQDAGDDIAGELADDMLNGADEEDGDEAPEDLMSWLAQQRGGEQEGPSQQEADTQSPEVPSKAERPLTPPSSVKNRSTLAEDMIIDSNTKGKDAEAHRAQQNANMPASGPSTRKRKADHQEVDATDTTNATKKRATSSHAPDLAAAAKATTTDRGTRTGRGKRT